jgi:hypothetical protein
VKVTPISLYRYIKIITAGYYLICRNSIEVQTKEKSIVYDTILKLIGETLEEIIPTSIENLKGPKNLRGIKMLWKCSEYIVPIYKPEEPC